MLTRALRYLPVLAAAAVASGPSRADADSPCTLLDPSGAPVCTDADADGRPGRSAACPSAADCDDTNPTIHPRAPEIPGDGVDNTCGGGLDTPVDEAHGVFVGIRGNNGSQAGTRQAPYKKLALGVAEAARSGKVVFVAAGIYDSSDVFELPDTTTVSIIGGFQEKSWSRVAGARSVVTIPRPLAFASQLLVGIDFSLGSAGSISLAPLAVTTVIDSSISGGAAATVTTHGQSRMIDVSVAGPVLTIADGTLVAIRGRFGSIGQAGGTAVELDRSTVAGTIDSAGTLALNRSFLRGTVSSANGFLRIGSSTFRPQAGNAVTLSAGVLLASNSIFEGAAVAIAHTAQTITVVKANLFDAGCALSRDGVCLTGPCGFDGNVCDTPAFVADGDFHLAPGSVGIDLGQRFEAGLTPSMSAVDHDGQCRVGELDLGADEVR